MAFTEREACNLLGLAIRNEQAAELLNTLIEGGGFTLDPLTNRFIMLPAAMIQEILEASNHHDD